MKQTITHTRCSSSSFIVTLSLIRRRAYARAQFSRCSSTTNANSETGQMAVCCQNLTLGVFSSCSAFSVLVGALFKKFRLFLNTPRISQVIINFYRNTYDFSCLAPYGGPVEPGLALGGFEGSDYSQATGLSISFLVNNYHNKTLLQPAMEWELRLVIGYWTCCNEVRLTFLTSVSW